MDIRQMKPSEVICKSISEIMNRGWCQGGLQDGQGHVCGEGAVILTLGGSILTKKDKEDAEYTIFKLDTSTGFRALYAVRQSLNNEVRLINPDIGDFVAYNDLPSTTQEDVILVMKGAVERLEAEGL